MRGRYKDYEWRFIYAVDGAKELSEVWRMEGRMRVRDERIGLG